MKKKEELNEGMDEKGRRVKKKWKEERGLV